MSDWLPGKRADQLAMAKNWLNVLETQTGGSGGSISNAEKWGVPGVVVNELAELKNNAENALIEAQSRETRTPVVNVRCKTAFDELTAKMRDIKDRERQKGAVGPIFKAVIP